MNKSGNSDPLQARTKPRFALNAWWPLCLMLAFASSSPAFAETRPAIANTPPCNSATVTFSPIGDGAQAVTFVRSLQGVGHIEKNSDGTYNAEFAGPEEVNALIDDLNKNHAAQIIDLFQFFQCKYRLF